MTGLIIAICFILYADAVDLPIKIHALFGVFALGILSLIFELIRSKK